MKAQRKGHGDFCGSSAMAAPGRSSRACQENFVGGLGFTVLVTGMAWGEPDGGGERWKPIESLAPDASLEQSVALIRSWNEIQSERIGIAGTHSVVHAAFLRLKQLADVPTLRKLVEDPSPAVRVCAFRALVDGNPQAIPFEVLLAHAGDVAKVGAVGGDVYSTGVVIDLLVAYVEPRLSREWRTRLLERLLQSTTPTPGTEKALDAWRVDGRLYGTIRERVLSGTVAALPALARFRRPADLPLIERALSTSRWEALGAVAEFPAPSFLPLLRTT